MVLVSAVGFCFRNEIISCVTPSAWQAISRHNPNDSWPSGHLLPREISSWFISLLIELVSSDNSVVIKTAYLYFVQMIVYRYEFSCLSLQSGVIHTIEFAHYMRIFGLWKPYRRASNLSSHISICGCAFCWFWSFVCLLKELDIFGIEYRCFAFHGFGAVAFWLEVKRGWAPWQTGHGFGAAAFWLEVNQNEAVK